MSQRHPVQNDVPMLITTNVADRKPMFRNPAFAREAIDVLYRVQELRPFFLFGFVVMPDHCHFLLNVPEPGSVSTIMKHYKMGVSHSIGLGPIWQPRFHMRIVRNIGKALRYVHLNPVRAGLAEHAEGYPWSSASGQWDVKELGWM